MRVDRLAFGSSLAAAIAVAACGSVLQEPTPDGGRPPCRDLGESACRSRSDCAVNSCGAPCGGGGPLEFINCYDPTVDPRVFCEELACPAPCSALDEASCKTRTDCRVDSCVSCPGQTPLVTCKDADDPTHTCLTIACPAPCASMTTQDSCDARPDCHPVFVDGRNCACAAVGCCAQFSYCADGATAACHPGAILCDALPPYCEGSYVVGYSSGCYEGCVRSIDCGQINVP